MGICRWIDGWVTGRWTRWINRAWVFHGISPPALSFTLPAANGLASFPDPVPCPFFILMAPLAWATVSHLGTCSHILTGLYCSPPQSLAIFS